MKKFAVVLIVLAVFVTGFSLNVGAAGYEFDFERDGKKVELTTDVLLMASLDTGDIVFDKGGSERRYPASTTKIMTYIVVAENVDDFENTRVPIKQEVLSELDGTGSSLSGLYNHVGSDMSVIDLLHCLMVSSGNDAALVLADYVGGGSVQNFVDMMNAKAEELGCEDTHFMNPHGLHDENHYTTAYDLYKIAKYALTLPKFSEITNTTTYYCEGDDYPLITTNLMIDENRGGEYFYRYARGIKTGSTDAAGRCLVSTAFYEGYSYIIVALHASMEGQNTAMIDSANLYRWAFLNLELKPIVTVSTPVCEQKLDLAWKKEGVLLSPENNFSTLLPKTAADEDIRIEPHIKEIVDAPVTQGDIMGTADVYYQDTLVTTINLVSTETVERSQLLYFLRVAKNILSSTVFLICTGIAIVLIIIYLIISTIYGRRSKKRRNVKNYRNF